MIEGVTKMSDGCSISWRMDGDPSTPPLLLSNSLGTTMHMWDAQIEAFSANYCVIRYDSRGHGRSSVPAGNYTLARLAQDAVELLDRLSLEKVRFCGLSLGGMVGQWLGANAANRLDKLIIANSSAYMGPPAAWHDRMALVRQSGMEAIADAVVERWFTPQFRATSPGKVEPVRQMLLATAADGYCGSCAAIAAMDMRDTLSSISTETLVIGGLLDPATPPDHAHMLAKGVAGSTLVEFPAAHLSNVECPEKFAAAVLDFLARA